MSAHCAGEGVRLFPLRTYGTSGRFSWGDHAMRVTNWNCLCGDVSDRLSDLKPLCSDLITLQECRRPASDSASVIWRGDISYQGVAVVSTEAAWRLEFVEIPELHPTVVPVRVQAPQPFVFVGVWAHPPFNKVAWEAMRACVAAANGLPVVAAGDFNSSPSVKGQERTSPQFLQRMRDELGLVSAYHHFFGESYGEETRASYYHWKKEANPFHIDYCFVPDAWVDRLTSVEVGSFAAWPQSDHRPLTVDIR